jgi:hypothetical protein
MTRLLLLGYCLRDRNQNVDCQKPDAVLVICCKVLKQGDHLFDNDRVWHGLDEFREVVRRLSSDHGGIIVH